MIKQELDIESFEKNLMDVITESHLKLGYSKSEVRFYYPLDSLNRLLNSELPAESMGYLLENLKTSSNGILRYTQFSHKENRFCLSVSAEGAEYVHEQMRDTAFLKEFIEGIQQGRCNINDILTIFLRHSDEVKYIKLEDNEFDYLVYFENGIPDSYRYCIKFELEHATYHRFTIKDYEAMNF